MKRSTEMGNDIREYLDQWPSRWKVDGQVLNSIKQSVLHFHRSSAVSQTFFLTKHGLEHGKMFEKGR